MRLLIADQQVLFRSSLRALLETRGYEVVAEAGTGPEAVARAKLHHPDVVLIDLEMPEWDGLETLDRLQEDQPEIQVVILTGLQDDQRLLRALESGARGYLHKSVRPSRFFALLEGLVRGEPALSPGMAHEALMRIVARSRGLETAEPRSAPPPKRDVSSDIPIRLTDREREVLALMAGGRSSTRALAERLGVGERTVKFHVGNLLQKLQVGSRTEAVAFAMRRRMVEPRT